MDRGDTADGIRLRPRARAAKPLPTCPPSVTADKAGNFSFSFEIENRGKPGDVNVSANNEKNTAGARVYPGHRQLDRSDPPYSFKVSGTLTKATSPGSVLVTITWVDDDGKKQSFTCRVTVNPAPLMPKPTPKPKPRK